MSIRRTLILIAVMPLLIVFLIGVSTHLLNRDLDEMRAVPHMADDLESEIDLLEFSADEYFDSGSRRARQQAMEGFARIHALLEQAENRFNEPSDVAKVREIHARMRQAKWSFEEYSRLDNNTINEVQKNYQNGIADRMRMELRSLTPLANRLHHDAHDAIRAFSDSSRWWETLALFLIALAALALLSPLIYRINTGLNTLLRGIREMESGGLRRDLELTGNDEFQQLATRFNQMAHQIATAEREKTQHIEQLNTANKDLENFSYSVSHDLRSPLRAIDGFIAMLLEDHTQKLDSEGQRLFNIVRQNARKMGDLIDDILALSRAGRLELESLNTDMDRLVEEVWQNLSVHQAGRNVILKHDPLPDAQCDPRAIRQVWQNLLDNAVKFTCDRDPAEIHVSAVVEETMVRYSVSDNGAGFNPAYADKLFTLFQRLHGMDEFEGTGVGLAISKRLITKHNGSIAATAKPDEGATFSFTLPQAPPQPKTI